MRHLSLFLLLSSVALIASACSSRPVVTVASHPPAIDLSCPDEPAVPEGDLTREQADDFNNGTLLAGRVCRDTLRRVCEWHRARGYKEAQCNP